MAKCSDSEMAAEFGVSDKVISHLRHHFETVGLQSIQAGLIPALFFVARMGRPERRGCLFI